MVNLSFTFASRGSSSVNLTPGSLVSMALKLLLTLSGTPSLGSHRSRWLGPPWRETRMTLLALPKPGPCDAGGGQFRNGQLVRGGGLRRGAGGALPADLPDGFADLGPHSLVTFKSHQEALDIDAVVELLGHFANYRKQEGPDDDHVLPAD